MDDNGREYITMAAQLSSNGYYSNAFDLYLLAFNKNTELKALFETEFRSTLTTLNELLIHNGRAEEAFVNFGRAVEAFPENLHLINDTGKYLFKYGFYMEAWSHFQKALKMDSGFVNAERNLNSLKNFLVERWHYRMLNDKLRNETYCDAIKKTVVPYKDSILDLGAGTGLLSLYCMECEPMTLTACDASEQMVKMAECIFEDNDLSDTIIVNNMSTDTHYKDIGGRKSLLVTELFDAGLFGEHILHSLNHAHEHLLQKVGRVIPNKAEFFVIGAKCEHLNFKYQLGSAAKTILNIPTQKFHILTEDETYDCEDVYKFKGLKYMTESQSVLKIDFNNQNDIQEKLNNTEPYEVELKAIDNGDIDVLIGWFNLYLTDKITLTTDPRSDKRANAWQQAVFFDFLPQCISKGKTINTKFVLNNEKLTLVSSVNNNDIQRISPETLRFLNDAEYVTMIKRCLGMASVYLGQMTEMSQITIVDLSPFPLFGILMLKRGVQSVTCSAKTADDKKFLKNVLKANNISLSKIKLLSGDDWTQNSFMDEKYHAIFCNVFDVCGDIDMRMHAMANHLKNAHLLPGGLFMPASVGLVAQVVNSHWLDINNRVYDTNTSDYKIGKYINKYQVSQNFCIDFTSLEYTPLTEPANLGRHGNEVSGIVNVPIVKTGDANAILSWFTIELMEGLGEISTNRRDSFIDGVVFLANPSVRMVKGKEAHILRCMDSDGAFKLVIDLAT